MEEGVGEKPSRKRWLSLIEAGTWLSIPRYSQVQRYIADDLNTAAVLAQPSVRALLKAIPIWLACFTLSPAFLVGFCVGPTCVVIPFQGWRNMTVIAVSRLAQRDLE